MKEPRPGERSEEAARALHSGDYVARYHREDNGRLSRLLPLMILEPHMTVADIGCGNALLLDLIHDRVGEYHGVDFSADFIAEARRRQSESGIANATFHRQSVADFCATRPRRFDRMFAMDLTEHIDDAALLEMARALHGALRPGGVLYLHTPNARFFLEALRLRGILPQSPQHIAVRDAEAMRELFGAAGFREVRVTPLPHYLSLLSWLHPLSRLPGIGGLFEARLFAACVA